MTFLKIIDWLKRYFYAEIVDGRKYVIGGLLPHVEDERDFGFGFFKGLTSPYQPKNQTLNIQTVSIKNQQAFNDCTWNAKTVQAEVDEKVPLSVRSLVCYGRSKNYLSGNGFATLRATQQATLEFGIAQEVLLPTEGTNWETFSSPSNLSQAIIFNAATHKDKNYFLVRSKDEWLKALDDGHVIQTGMDWYSGYNQRFGLTSPWILPWQTGTLIGGHSFVYCGYNIPRGLLKFQNSFGPSWGDNGCFYISMDTWFKSGNVGYVSMKLDTDALSNFITTYEGQQVKGSAPTIYLIQGGKKRSFPNELVFYAFGGRFETVDSSKTWNLVADSLLTQIPEGDPLSITESTFWPLLKDNWTTLQWLKSPDNFQEVDKIINANK